MTVSGLRPETVKDSVERSTQVGHNRTNNFSDYLRFFLENSDFLRLSKIVIILSSKKHGFSQKINVKT